MATKPPTRKWLIHWSGSVPIYGTRIESDCSSLAGTIPCMVQRSNWRFDWNTSGSMPKVVKNISRWKYETCFSEKTNKQINGVTFKHHPCFVQEVSGTWICWLRGWKICLLDTCAIHHLVDYASISPSATQGLTPYHNRSGPCYVLVESEFSCLWCTQIRSFWWCFTPKFREFSPKLWKCSLSNQNGVFPHSCCSFPIKFPCYFN